MVSLRNRFHPVSRLRRAAAYRRLTRAIRVPVRARIGDLREPIYVDLMKNVSLLLSSGAAELRELANFRWLAREMEAQKFWDVGANVGVYSFAFWEERPGGAATLFEPDPANCALLRRSLARHARDSAALVQAAVSDADGEAEFSLDELSGATGTIAAGAGTFNERLYGVRPSRIVVPTVSGATALRRHGRPDIVKIDVEGAENLVFAGARAVIEEVRPAIVFEAADGFDPRLLDAAGYRLFDFQTLEPIATARHNNLALHPDAHAAVLARLAARRAELG